MICWTKISLLQASVPSDLENTIPAQEIFTGTPFSCVPAPFHHCNRLFIDSMHCGERIKGNTCSQFKYSEPIRKPETCWRSFVQWSCWDMMSIIRRNTFSDVSTSRNDRYVRHFSTSTAVQAYSWLDAYITCRPTPVPNRTTHEGYSYSTSISNLSLHVDKFLLLVTCR